MVLVIIFYVDIKSKKFDFSGAQWRTQRCLETLGQQVRFFRDSGTKRGFFVLQSTLDIRPPGYKATTDIRPLTELGRTRSSSTFEFEKFEVFVRVRVRVRVRE